jgi:hypothetical protein
MEQKNKKSCLKRARLNKGQKATGHRQAQVELKASCVKTGSNRTIQKKQSSIAKQSEKITE